MPTNKLITKTEQVLAKHERQLALHKLKERKAQTRRKIEFGGLVVKSQMDKYNKAVILGALIDAFENCERDAAMLRLFQIKGENSFMGYI